MIYDVMITLMLAVVIVQLITVVGYLRLLHIYVKEIRNRADEIAFTQYIHPTGERVRAWFETEYKEVFDKAIEIAEAGFHFKCELLSTGHYSGTIGDHNGDYANVITRNGPPTVEATEKMIMNFNIEDAKTRSKALEGEDDAHTGT